MQNWVSHLSQAKATRDLTSLLADKALPDIRGVATSAAPADKGAAVPSVAANAQGTGFEVLAVSFLLIAKVCSGDAVGAGVEL